MRILCIGVAAALLAACAAVPIQPSSERPSSTPARFDYERDDDLDNDLLSRSAVPGGIDRLA